MKKLIVALFASATVLFASAAVKNSEGFEGDSIPDVWGTGGSPGIHNDSAPSSYPFSGTNAKYCVVDADDTYQLVSPSASEATYFDMFVKFTVREDGGTANLGNDAKLAVYLNSTGNIVVRSGDEGTQPINTDAQGNPDVWTRLTIAKADNGFKVYIGGQPVLNGRVFAPIGGGDVDGASQVAFDGSGALDNFVARTTDPFIQNPAATIGGEGYASYTDALKEALKYKTSSETLTITVGDTDMDGTAANPYQIANVADLIALKDAVLANEYVRSLNFVQTANIDMSSADPFAGIGTYGDAALTHADAVPFKGTYDGNGYKISNVTFTDRGYAGVFNRVDGGTIKNLTVENAGYVGDSGDYSASIVGYALNGAKLENLVSAGTFGSKKKPASHNLAGIVVRVSGGTEGDGTQILNCTNNAALYGAYTKLAGICAISQEKIKDNNPRMVFSGCANNGDIFLIRSSTGITGLAGIVGYSDVNTVMTDCSNTGSIEQSGDGFNTDCTGALIGNTYGHSITDGGGNSAPSDMKMIGKWGGATEYGFLYATVDNGVATTVTGALAKDTTYLLEGKVAASETPVFTLAAAGDTFKIDTALGYTFAGTVASDRSKLMPVTSEKVGSVTTYTATAGVASVDGEAYATFADAVDALDGATDDYVTLLADMQTMYTLDSEGTQKTLKVKTNNHCCLVNVGAEDVLVYQAVGGVATYVSKHGVATFNNTNYLSLLSAIAAAAEATGDDKTVKLLSNISLDARVEPNLGSGKSLTIDLGGKTITRTGTSGNGSVFDVKSGNVVITNGVIDCTQDDAAIVAGGVYAITARSGANVTLGGLTVTVRSQAGACVYPFAGAHVTILSGTYANTTQNDYQYKAGWRGMAVNQANVASQLIAISGGSFKQVNPALGDDSWASAGNGFLASGYAATWNPSTGYYEVAEYVPPSGIDADQSETVEVDTTKTPEEQEQDAIDAVTLNITVPEAVAEKVSGLTQSDYQDYFKKVATPGTGADEGKWVVTAELDETKVFTATESEEAATEQSILAAALGEESTAATVRAAKPGLYYSMEASNDIGFAAGKGTLEGDRTLATGTTVDIEKPNTPSGNAVFFRVKVSRTDK